jgi:hypothetical protein
MDTTQAKLLSSNGENENPGLQTDSKDEIWKPTDKNTHTLQIYHKLSK